MMTVLTKSRGMRALCRVAVAATLIVAAASAYAQQYPNRPIHVISPYPAGSASDTVTRVVMDQVSQLIGQPVVIDLKPGAGGAVGFASVARSDPDGYTLATSSSSMATETVLAQQAAVRSQERFRQRGPARHLAEHSGRVGQKRLQDGGRSRQRRQGEARHADLCLRGHRLLRTWRPSDSVSPRISTSATYHSRKAAWCR